MKKIKNHQRPRRKYRFDIVGHKKAWWDSPFNLRCQRTQFNFCRIYNSFRVGDCRVGTPLAVPSQLVELHQSEPDDRQTQPLNYTTAQPASVSWYNPFKLPQCSELSRTARKCLLVWSEWSCCKYEGRLRARQAAGPFPRIWLNHQKPGAWPHLNFISLWTVN